MLMKKLLVAVAASAVVGVPTYEATVPELVEGKGDAELRTELELAEPGAGSGPASGVQSDEPERGEEGSSNTEAKDTGDADSGSGEGPGSANGSSGNPDGDAPAEGESGSDRGSSDATDGERSRSEDPAPTEDDHVSEQPGSSEEEPARDGDRKGGDEDGGSSVDVSAEGEAETESGL